MDSVDSSLFKSSEIRNSPGDGLYVGDSTRMSIENSAFVDGCLSDREPFKPLVADGSKVLRVNDCLFENYPGALDVSATEVVATGGNIVRNCGTGLRIHASSKVTTTNNIILGPSDEYIPSPDIYDSDFNSVNLTIDRDVDFQTPFYQYLRDGSEYNLSDVDVVAGIATIVGQGTTNETLGDKFLMFSQSNGETVSNGTQFGYLSFKLTAAETATLGLTSSLGYDIIGTEFLTVPLGFSASVGIKTGAFNQTAIGATNYQVELKVKEEHTAFAIGDVVKLEQHSSTPDLTGIACTVSQKIVGGLTASITIDLPTPTTLLSSNGAESGYISIRNIFTIAKGRVGVI